MLLSVVALLTAVASVDASTCYYPDKSVAPDVPCNGSATQSACCGSASYCLSNGVCLTDGIISRGSCTDENWDASECCPYCTDDNTSGGSAIMPCTNSTFTCGFSYSNCESSSSTFTMSNMGKIVLKSSQLTSAMQAAGLEVGSNSSTSTEEDGSTATSVSVVTVTASGEASSAGTTSTGYTAGDMAGVGAGVGIPLLLAVGALGYLLAREKKRNAAPQSAEFQALNTVPNLGMNKEANSWLSWSDASPRPGSRPTELGSESLIQELEPQGRPVELGQGR